MGDAAYLRWLRGQPCAVQPCITRSEAHHSLSAPTYAPGERQPKQLPGKKGQSQKSADYYAFAICPRHHKAEFHGGNGFFEGWSNEQRNAWEAEMSAKYRAEYEAELAARGEAMPATGERLIAPVPGLLDDFDVERAASDFLSEYEGKGGPQAHHDLCRLLRAAIRAAREGRAA